MKKIIAIILVLNLMFAFAGSASAATISGTKFNDVNGNGTMDVGEVGLPGVLIYLDQNASGTLDGADVSVVTDANGSFSFPNLADGSYSVREVSQIGWTQTTPGAGTNFQQSITVTAGNNVGAINFGNQLTVAAPIPGTITGTKFNDLDGDGVRDAGEPGIAGVSIFLDANTNNAFDAGETSVVTDVSGNYTFSGLLAGMFTVREGATVGWNQTFPGSGAGFEQTVGVGAGANISGIDFGNQLIVNAVTGTISGMKFNDLNANGAWDAGEPGIAGINVYLDSDNDMIWDAGEAVVTTDASGNYRFVGLAAGTYSVREQGQAGWTQTFPTVGANFRHSINLAMGANVSGINFANYRLGTLTDPVIVTDPTGGVGGQGEVLGDAVGGDSLPVTGITIPMLLGMLLAFVALGYHSLFARNLIQKSAKKN